MGLSVFHKPLSFPAGPLLHPAVRQISHKGAAKDQDDGESEDDNPHVPDVHSRVLVITVESGLFSQRFLSSGSGSSCQRKVGSDGRFPARVDGAITALEELDSQRTRAAGSPRVAATAKRRRPHKPNIPAAITDRSASSRGRGRKCDSAQLQLF